MAAREVDVSKAEVIRDGLARLLADGPVSVSFDDGHFNAASGDREPSDSQRADMLAIGWMWDDVFDCWWVFA